MRVLVTRPQASGARTAAALAALGHRADLLPLFEPVHDRAAAAAALARPATGLIITSAEAVRAITTPIAASVLARPVYAVGERTAEAAREKGFTRVENVGGTGAALADLVATAGGCGDAPYIYLAGEPRSSQLEAGLKAAGISCETVVVYHMRAIEYKPEVFLGHLSPEPDVVLLYSEETAARFFALVGQLSGGALGKTGFLCLSERIAGAVPRQYDRQVEVAEKPSESSLLELLSKAKVAVGGSHGTKA